MVLPRSFFAPWGRRFPVPGSRILSDPLMELHDPNGNTLLTNDNWQESEGQKADINAAGLAPSDPKESAMLMMLPPGAYTAVVRGNGGGTGIALAEIYQLP